MQLEESIDLKDLAKILKKSEFTLRKICKSKPEDLPPFFRVGKNLRWKPSDVALWIEEQKQQTCQPKLPKESHSKKKPGRPTKTQAVQQRRLANGMA